MSSLTANGLAEPAPIAGTRRHAATAPPLVSVGAHTALPPRSRDPRERSGTVILFATLASGNEKLLKRDHAPSTSTSSSGTSTANGSKKKTTPWDGDRKKRNGTRISRDDSETHQRPKREERAGDDARNGRNRSGSVSADDGGRKRRESDVSSSPSDEHRSKSTAVPHKQTHDHDDCSTKAADKKENEAKSRTDKPRMLSSSGGVRTHRRRRSWSKDNEEKKKPKQSGHRRSRSRIEGRMEGDYLNTEIISEELSRIRRGSDPVRPSEKSVSRRPSAAQDMVSENHASAISSGARSLNSPSTGQSGTQVAPLNLKTRERARSTSEDGEPSKERKSILDKVALLLSPGRRQRDDDLLVPAASRSAAHKGTEPARENAERGASRQSSESSLSTSSSSIKTKTPREKRRDSEATDEIVVEPTQHKGRLPSEDSGREENAIAKDRVKEMVTEQERSDDLNAPKRRSALALRKRFSTVSQSQPADEARSKRFKQLSNAGHRATEISSLLAHDGGELGSRRSGRSSSSPNVSQNIPKELRVWWEDFNKDEQDLDMLYGDGVSLVSGVGVGGAGMGTLLVRMDNNNNDATATDPDSNSNSAVSLPRRVLRSSSHNSRNNSVIESSFLRRTTPIMLEELLHNKSMRTIFYQHVEKSLCAENVEFYDAVQQFKTLFNEEDKSEERMHEIKNSADYIYNNYIAPEAQKQVNIDITMSRNLKARLDTPTQDMFHDAERSIRELIHCSILPKFYQSTEFRTVAELEEVKLALVVENEKLRRLLDKLGEQRGRIGLLEQKQAMLNQYFNNFEQAAAEFMRNKQEKQKDCAEAPASKLSTIIGRAGASNASSKSDQEKPSSTKRWGLWPEQKGESNQHEYIICIEVTEAQDLIAKRGFCSPYVVVKYGRQKYTTKTVFKNLNPRWREHFFFNVKHDEIAKLWITVWDYNMIGPGEFLGCVSFASPRLFINSSDRWWTLEPRKEGESVSGKIRLQMHYRKQMDREEELSYELQKVRNAIREETSSLQKTALGLWGGRSADAKDDGGREKLLRTLKERRQKLEKEASEREKDSPLASSLSSSPPALDGSSGGTTSASMSESQ